MLPKPLSAGKWLTYCLSLLAVIILLVFGLTLPMLTLSKFYFFNNSVSVISGIRTLWIEQHYAIFILIVLFSVLLPLIKIAVLARVIWQLRPIGIEEDDAQKEAIEIGVGVEANKVEQLATQPPSTLISSASTSQKLINLMHAYGRWGMLDVFVVAVLIVTVKLKAIASVEIHIGLYLFGAAVLLLNLITHFLSKRASLAKAH